MATIHRYKYGIFLHPALPTPGVTAWTYAQELIASFTDTVPPHLGKVEVKWEVRIRRLDDSVVFAADHRPGAVTLIVDDLTGPVRAGLLEALDWWNGETLLIAPANQGLVWDGPSLPNAWSNPWGDGLQIQTITQYPGRLGKRVLAEWNPGLKFFPFELFYEPPTQEQEAEARAAWAQDQEALVKQALANLVPATTGPWFLAPAQRYRGALAPLPSGFRAVGSKDQAEAAAEYRGLCFLVDRDTGETLSRWAER